MNEMMTSGGIAALALAMLVGCGDDTVDVDPAGPGGSGGAGGEGSASSSSGSGGEPVNPVSLEFRVSVFGSSGLIGATVCQLETDNCDQTRSWGFVRLSVPGDLDEFVVSVEHPQIRPMVVPVAVTNRPETYQLVGLTPAQTTVMGVPAGDGAHLAHVVGAPGATIAVNPSSVADVVYGSTEGIDPGATDLGAEPTSGYALLDAEPGVHTVLIQDPPGPCDLSAQWRGEEANTFRVPLVAGFITLPIPFGCQGGDL